MFRKSLLALSALFIMTSVSACSTGDNPIAVIETSMGQIQVEIFQNETPELAKNFITLAEEGKYDNVPFHRVIPNFMIQTGDFTNMNGTGGHSYKGPGQDLAGEYGGGSNLRGTLSMANRGPDTNGSQFFINLVDNTYLDHDQEPLSSKHPVFGKVVEGMDVIDSIGSVDTLPGDKPVEEISILSVEMQ
jgi:cyclophilin family peptidyl-prolyl cis-trans isomerase